MPGGTTPPKAPTRRTEDLELPGGPRYRLAAVRVALGTTQTQVAKRAGMAQGDISLLEHREDVKVSTLGRYAAALGGRLEMAIVVGGQRYLVEVGR